jgi:hypothetical protein
MSKYDHFATVMKDEALLVATFYQRFLGHRADPSLLKTQLQGRPSDCLTPTFRFSSHAVAPILV